MKNKRRWYSISITNLIIPIYIILSGFGIFFYALFETNKDLVEREQEQIIKWEQEQTKIKKTQQEQYKQISELIKQKQPKLDQIIIDKITLTVLKYSKQYNFPYTLILAIINRESTFNPLAISKANCIGLMQINPKAHQNKIKKLKAKHSDLFHIDTNVHLGCIILSEYYQQAGSISGALKRYVGGKHTDYIYDILSDYTDLTIKN